MNSVTYVSTPGARTPIVGNLVVTFNGQMQYRGASYYSADFSGGAFANGLRDYFSLSGGALFEEAETDMLFPVIPGCVAPKREVIFGQGPSIYGTAAASGTASLYQCFVLNGSVAWSVTITDAGQATSIVPAGIFATHVWRSVWKYGTNERDFTTYLFGQDVIERDVQESNSGVEFAAYSTQLSGGPTSMLIPPLPLAFSYNM